MENEKLVHALGNCINHCNYCADACLDEENVKMMVRCIRMDGVCAEVCSTLNQLLVTGYSDINDLVKYCVKVCNACADECEKHEAQHCKECSKACRDCSQACMAFLE